MDSSAVQRLNEMVPRLRIGAVGALGERRGPEGGQSQHTTERAALLSLLKE
ncbi:MAG: hypothetical protein ACE5G7_06540 [Candidatus Hydrothermarchaeaceae archaeon]